MICIVCFSINKVALQHPIGDSVFDGCIVGILYSWKFSPGSRKFYAIYCIEIDDSTNIFTLHSYRTSVKILSKTCPILLISALVIDWGQV